MAKIDSTANNKEMSVEQKLKALYDLQKASSDIDKIRTLRGELPLEVQDLEDEIEGLETRIGNFEGEIKNSTTPSCPRRMKLKRRPS